jgi:hypothetical protein
MYKEHVPIISAYACAEQQGFLRAALFCVLSIRQSILKVPAQLDEVISGDLSPLWGHKRDAYVHLSDHTGDLQKRVLVAPTLESKLVILCEVPGLGIVKSAFLLQIMGENIACLDSRNLAADGANPRAWRTDGRKPACKKITRYVAATHGKAELYWDRWCCEVATVRGWNAEDISALHLSIVPEDYIPF